MIGRSAASRGPPYTRVEKDSTGGYETSTVLAGVLVPVAAALLAGEEPPVRAPGAGGLAHSHRTLSR